MNPTGKLSKHTARRVSKGTLLSSVSVWLWLWSQVVPTGSPSEESAHKLRLPPSGRKDTDMTPSFKEFLLAVLETDHSRRLAASEVVYRIPKESEWLEITTKKISL